MNTRIIRDFVTANATNVLQDYLLYEKQAAEAIVQQIQHLPELVMLKQFLPVFNKYMLRQLGAGELTDSQENVLYTPFIELPGNTTEQEFHFSLEFRSFYTSKLKDIISTQLNNVLEALIAAKEYLNILPVETFYIIYKLPDTSKNNTITYLPEFARLAKSRIIEAAQTFSVDRDYFIYKNLLNLLGKQFINIPPEIQSNFVYRGYLETIQETDDLMEHQLQLPQSDRLEILRLSNAAQIHHLSLTITKLLTHAYNLIRRGYGANPHRLKTELSEFFHNKTQKAGYGRLTEHSITFMLISDNFISSLCALPAIGSLEETHPQTESSYLDDSRIIHRGYFELMNNEQAPQYHENFEVPAIQPPRIAEDNIAVYAVAGMCVLGLFAVGYKWCTRDKKQNDTPELRQFSRVEYKLE
jgi:hypothetical protein